MSNNELEAELLQHFGLEKTINFCKMNSFMYDMLYEEYCKDSPLEICDYDYESQWWSDKGEELTKLMK